MNECYKCREHKKVRKIHNANGRFMTTPIFEFSYWYDYICEDCDKALKIMKKKEYIKEQKAWIKQRDKILKEEKEE